MNLNPLTYSGPGGSGGGISASEIYTETPTGAINSSNTVYTTANPITKVLSLHINGQTIPLADISITDTSEFTLASALDASLSGFPFEIVYV